MPVSEMDYSDSSGNRPNWPVSFPLSGGWTWRDGQDWPFPDGVAPAFGFCSPRQGRAFRVRPVRSGPGSRPGRSQAVLRGARPRRRRFSFPQCRSPAPSETRRGSRDSPPALGGCETTVDFKKPAGSRRCGGTGRCRRSPPVTRVHPNQVSTCKREAIGGLDEVFGGGRASRQ